MSVIVEATVVVHSVRCEILLPQIKSHTRRPVGIFVCFPARVAPDWFVLDQSGESVFSLAMWADQLDLASQILIAATRQQVSSAADGCDGGVQVGVLARLSGFNHPTLLHRAVVRDHVKVIEFLLRHGADVNER